MQLLPLLLLFSKKKQILFYSKATLITHRRIFLITEKSLMVTSPTVKIFQKYERFYRALVTDAFSLFEKKLKLSDIL